MRDSSEKPVDGGGPEKVPVEWPLPHLAINGYCGILVTVDVMEVEMVAMQLVEIDSRGRVTLGRAKVAAGRYLLEVASDGVLLLHPAAVMTNAQARLLARADIMEIIDTLADQPAKSSARGRPKRPSTE
jgi:hypothetical protein